jgi:protein-tyrosine phosphatase
VDFVRPGLAVGTRLEAESARLLSLHKIDAVLSMTSAQVPASFDWLQLVVSDRVPLPDGILDRAVAFLTAQLSRAQRVLVHCEMGLSRSPAVVACFLAARERLPLEVALGEVRRARPLVQPHPALLQSVDEFLSRDQVGATLRGVA